MELNNSLLQCAADIELHMKAERKHLMTFHCEKCNALLGDSLCVCGELKWKVPLIMCLKVTETVVVSDAEVSEHEGELSNCIYSSLQCGRCCSVVGNVIHASPPHLAAVRSLFLLSKASISCYILNSTSMVKASTLSFDMKPHREAIDKMRQQFEDQMEKIQHIERMLARRSTSRLN